MTRNTFYEHLAIAALQNSELGRILGILQETSISVIALKGSALLQRVYAEGQRSMYDVDLLVLKKDLVQAEAILEELGYGFSNEGMGWTLGFTHQFMSEVPYRKGAMVVELHWHVVASSWFRATTALDLGELWSRAIPTEIAGTPALRLCPEDELIHLCYHTAIHHGLAHQHGLRDILGVLHVEKDTLDWTVLAERACAWRVSVAVWAALSVARDKIRDKSKIPIEALEALHVPRWRQLLLRPFVHQVEDGHVALVSGTMRFLGVLLVDHVRDIPGVLLRGLFPGKRWLQLRYDLSPRHAFWKQFSYPLLVLKRGIGALVRTFFGSRP